MKLARLSLLLLAFAACSKKDDAPKKEEPKKEEPKKEEPKKEETKKEEPKKEEPKKEEPKKEEPKKEEPKKAEGSGSGSGSAGKDDFNFSAMKTEEQIDFMKKSVVPPMKEILSKFDPKEFGNVTCKTCHGKDPKGSKYAMPSPDLPKLDFAALKAGKLSEKDMKMAKFMADVVTPEMAKILHRPKYDPKTAPDGFGCLACHMEKK